MILFLNKNSRRGAILIVALWTMSFLAIFAAYVGLRVRQRVSLLSRVETNSQLRFLAESAVRKAIAVVKLEQERSEGKMTSSGKEYLFNNPKEFSSIKIAEGEFSIENFRTEKLLSHKYYGVTDEERKININHAKSDVLKRLFQLTANLKIDEAEELATSVLEWRSLHTIELTGFSTDAYYANLKSPYEPKRADFEILDEMLLVKGMTRKIFDQIIPFVTVYGDGFININTASREVLIALGLDGHLADKVVTVRRGVDHEEFTDDDYIFQKTFDIVSEMKNFVDIQTAEESQIDQLNRQNVFKVASSFYKIEGKALFRRDNLGMRFICVYNYIDQWVEYWNEKY